MRKLLTQSMTEILSYICFIATTPEYDGINTFCFQPFLIEETMIEQIAET